MNKLKINNKIIIISLLIILVFTFLFNFYSNSNAVVVDTTDGTGNRNTNAMYDSSKNRYYCVQPGVELGKSNKKDYQLVGTYAVSNQQLAYLCSLPDDTAEMCLGKGEWTQGGYFLGPKQNAIWHWIRTNQSTTPFVTEQTVEDVFGNMGDNGICTNVNSAIVEKDAEGNVVSSVSLYGTSTHFEEGTSTHITELKKMYKKYIEGMPSSASKTTLTPNIELSLDGDNVNASISGLLANTTYNLYGDGDTLLCSFETDNNGNKTVSIAATNFANTTATVKVKYKNPGYTATISVYSSGSDSQRIALVNGNTDDDEKTVEASIELYTDVSLQKYITKINGEALKTGDTVLTNRKNTYATNSDSTVVSKTEKDSMQTGKNKHDNVVLIEEGDTVTYRIYVYNNSNRKVNKIVVRDKALYYDNTSNQYANYTIEKITRDGDNTNIKSQWTKVSGTTTDEYEYTIENLDTYTYFDVTVKINKYEKEKILDNTAYIKETTPNNNTAYRTIDSDYIQLVQYSATAKKHISKIEMAGTDTEVTRDGMTAEMTQANPELIEKGSIVTYTIKVTNTSDVKTKIHVKDTISGFEYSDLKVSAWSYENGEGDLGTLSQVPLNKNILQAEGNMTSGATATCTISMKVEKLSDSTIGTNKIEAWPEKNPGDEGEKVEIPEYFKEKKYLASLHKIVSSVNEESKVTGTGITENRWASWESDENKSNKADKLHDKHNNPVTVGNGDIVTYTIKVKNDGTKLEGAILTKVNTLKAQQTTCYNELKVLVEKVNNSTGTEHETYKAQFNAKLNTYEKLSKELNEILEKCTTFTITEIEEKLPSGVEFVSCSEGKYENGTIKDLKLTLAPQEEKEITVAVKVTEPNISLNILKNEAKIKTIKNLNNSIVEDLTPNNNNDADYIQLKDITIEGMVWNDKALNKKQDNYNGKFDEKDETKLSNIKVYLYRNEKVIAETVTDKNGNYKFDSTMIKPEVINHECERFIKAPYQCQEAGYTAGIHQANYWKQQYYSYYIMFEYDGVTYTSTILKDEGNCLGIFNDNFYDSNAKEDLEVRKTFNNKFSTINNESNITYTTKNENGNIPQSNHKAYKDNGELLEVYKIKSSTQAINLSNNVKVEEQLKHINLGLRGRDIFDLELTSDVHKVQVKVNNQVGVYEYSNKVKLRNSDIEPDEDMANLVNEAEDAVVDSYTQDIREQELKASEKAVTSETITKYNDNQGLQEILVTYKITVTNASRTRGTATKVIDYYDSRYTVVKAYAGKNELKCENGTENGDGFNSVIITMPKGELAQAETKEIYLELKLNNPRSTLSGLLKDTTKPIPTYNMAEVYEYTTSCGDGQTEFTRGLLDKDSAPGSANKEKVRLTTTVGTHSTVQYYFNKKKAPNDTNADYLKELKYEDDTYATPTLYFGIPSTNNTRTLSGTVFRDETTVDTESKIKTGDGIQKDGEVGVYGATVELVEIETDKQPENIGKDEGIVRYRTSTDKNGIYTFKNFLPGNYIVRYYFGDNKKTVVANQYSTNINAYSYNGEDFQSTNNIGTHGANKLHGYNKTTGEFENTTDWYAYNEKDKISTGTENSSRRITVSDNVIAFNDKTMDLLNDLRDGKDIEDDNDRNSKNGNLYKMIDKTYMYATTPKFTLSVEKTETDSENKNPAQKTLFSEYKVSNMNFGLAEVPITTIDLQKHVKAYTIVDSAGDNTIVKVERDGNEWKVKAGNVLPGEKNGRTILDTSIEDDKLQGAKLQITYEVSTKIDIQKDFRSGKGVKPTITALADFIDNDLSYNAALGENDNYWEVKTAEDVINAFKAYYNNNTVIGEEPKGTVDPEHIVYTSQVFAKPGNPILNELGGTCEIVLEKTLSSEEVTVGDIITSNINTYEYDNAVEILGLAYSNTEATATADHPFRDRVRRTDKYIILPGTRHDSSISETITIHPPTGDTGISLTYYIIGAIGLAVLAIGVFGIKKFVVNTRK